MGYPLGLAPDAQGRGTTPEGVQRIIGAEYGSQGRISGCQIGLRGDMQYDVSAGAAVVRTGTGLAVKVPVEAVTVPTIAAPATGTRRDYIVVGVDGQVSVKQAKPATGAVIGEVNVPAGIIATTGASVLADARYARQIGTPLGPLVGRWTDPAAKGAAMVRPLTTIFQRTLPLLPTDRWVEVMLTQCLYASSDGGASAGGQGSAIYQLEVTNRAGPAPQRVELPYDLFETPRQFLWGLWVLASDTPSVVTVTRYHKWGTYGYHFPAGTIDVLDRGSAE